MPTPPSSSAKKAAAEAAGAALLVNSSSDESAAPSAPQLAVAASPAAPLPSACPAPLGLPPSVVAVPWGHQQEGYEFAVRTLEEHGAVLLAASMGVGKTFVSVLAALKRGARRVLIVAPKRVLQSWQEQLPNYLSSESYVLATLDDERGTCERRAAYAREREKLAAALDATFIVAVNYDAFWREPLNAYFKAGRWDVIIYDESHRLKSPSGRASRFAAEMRVHAKDVILASGTPLAHSPLDIFGQFRAAAPWVWGKSYTAFKARYAKLGGPQKHWVIGYQRVDELESRMAPLTWRKTKEEALPYLPPESAVEYSTEFSPEAKRIYKEFDKDFITLINGDEVTAANVLTKILRLQQIAGGAVPTDDGLYHTVDESKRQLLEDTLEDLWAPVVVFARFRSDIAFAHAAIKAAGFNIADGDEKSFRKYEISGSANDYRDWKQAAAAFNAGAGAGAAAPPALVVQLQSGSEGISLVEASTAIYYSLTPRLIEFDQSRARLHRPGQKNAVTYVYLTIKGTIDQHILASLLKRKDAIEEIMQSVNRRRVEKEEEKK